MKIIKYPRTPHLQGSRLQPGDEGLSQRPFADIAGRHVVVEEKIDGANVAISFSEDAGLLLQSRGHYLTGGYRERDYDLLKQWATVHRDTFFDILGDRYIMYGEWMHAKHSIYYDLLPDFFMEFDILDRATGSFLSTAERRRLTSRLPVSSCAVLAEGVFHHMDAILSHLGDSNYISDDHIANLREDALKARLDPDEVVIQTDPSRVMEGLYIKIEEDGTVVDRMKFVRPSFLQASVQTDNWLDRPMVTNRIIRPVSELFSR